MKYLWFILLPCIAFGKTPIDFKKWQLDDTTFSKQIGGSVRNYEKPDEAWAEIVNDFEIEGDSVVYVDQSVLKARVNKNGVCKVTLNWEDQEYTVTQKLLGIGWIKISTRQSLWIDSTMNWSNFFVDSNICRWIGISPGVDYRILKDNGRVAHGIFFKPAFLDSAVTLYNQRADSLDIALANVMVYTLSSNIDNADSAIGDLPKRRLKDFGYYTFNLGDQRLNFPGSDTLPRVPVRQYWERRGTKIICIEYVMMSHVKKVHETYPSATIWHNDTKTIDGTTNVEDAYLDSDLPDNNWGGTTVLWVHSSKIYVSLIRVKNVASELGVGATVTGAVCSLHCNYYGGGGNLISAYSVFKPWVEGDENGVDDDDGDVTYNDWASDEYEWTTAGCGSADDGGSDNSGDGTGADRKATAEDTETVDAEDIWFGWDVSSALVQSWYDETKNEEGILLVSDGAQYDSFISTEGASNQPFWVFTYTADGEPEPGQVIIIQ